MPSILDNYSNVISDVYRPVSPDVIDGKSFIIDGAAIPESDILAAEARLCRKHLKDFVHSFWHVLESRELVWNWHHDVICKFLESITFGKTDVKNIIIDIPPGCTKSLMFVFWRAWEWIDHPHLKYLCISYHQDLSTRDNRKVKKIVMSEKYQKLFWRNGCDKSLEGGTGDIVKISSDQSAKIKFENTAGGWSMATSVGGRGTGEHPDRIIFDDALKADDALSKAMRDDLWNFYKSTIPTRLANKPVVIDVSQRLHKEDLSGRLLQLGGWEHIVFPLEYDLEVKYACPCHANGPDHRDIRTQPGEILFPHIWTGEAIAKAKLTMSFLHHAQLGQNPTDLASGVIPIDKIKVLNSRPSDITISGTGYDTAVTSDAENMLKRKDSDRSAKIDMSLAQLPNNTVKVYIEIDSSHVLRVSDISDFMTQQAMLQGTERIIFEEQEPASGKIVCQQHASMLVGWDYEAIPVQKSKPVRAAAFISQVKAGNVYIICEGLSNGAMSSEAVKYLKVLGEFPDGDFDDEVDATSVVFNGLNNRLFPPEKKGQEYYCGSLTM